MISVGEKEEVVVDESGVGVGVGMERTGTVRVGFTETGAVGLREGFVLGAVVVFLVVEVVGFFVGLGPDTTATGRCVEAVATTGGCCKAGVSRTVCTVKVFWDFFVVHTWLINKNNTQIVCAVSTAHTICLAFVREKNHVFISLVLTECPFLRSRTVRGCFSRFGKSRTRHFCHE